MMTYTPTPNAVLEGKTCPYCGQKTEFVDSSIIYGRSYGMIYLCKPCDAYVGVHKGSDKALGRLANAELRELKNQAHKYFDMIWKDLKLMKRGEAYEWLSTWMGIPVELTHIGMFDNNQCAEAIEGCKQFLNDNRRLDMDFGLPSPTPYFE